MADPLTPEQIIREKWRRGHVAFGTLQIETLLTALDAERARAERAERELVQLRASPAYHDPGLQRRIATLEAELARVVTSHMVLEADLARVTADRDQLRWNQRHEYEPTLAAVRALVEAGRAVVEAVEGVHDVEARRAALATALAALDAVRRGTP